MTYALDALAHLTANVVFHFDMPRRNIDKTCFLHLASTSEDAICKATLSFRRGEASGHGRYHSQDLETRTQQEMRAVMHSPSLDPDDGPWDGKPMMGLKTLGLMSAALNF